MKYIIIPLFFIFSFVVKPKDRVVYILPLGNVNFSSLNEIKSSVETFYGFKCIIRDSVHLSKDILTESRKRYDALKILRKYNSRENLLIVTEKDIAHYNIKRGVKEWGIVGLGYRPGTVCVVSTYRIKKNVSEKIFIDRLKKVSIHEVGHNLGIGHCTKDKQCLMNDKNGLVSQIDKEKMFICANCRKSIR